MTEIERLHRRIDQQTAVLEARHAARLQCGRGCSACCVDEITVFPIEADLIRARAGDLLKHGAPAPAGVCAFLDGEGACRIYPWRPYVCRTQGLPLRWLEEENGEWHEYRDICPLNEEGDPIETLAETDCWTIGETESALAALQQKEHGSLTRVPLRSLFSQNEHT